MDEFVGAKRIEWSFKDRNNFVWQAMNNVEDPGITCKVSYASILDQLTYYKVASIPKLQRSKRLFEQGPTLLCNGLILLGITMDQP